MIAAIVLSCASTASAQSSEQFAICYGSEGGRTTFRLNASQTFASWIGLDGETRGARGRVSTRRNGSQFFFGTLELPNGEIASMALELGFTGLISSFTYNFRAFGREREVTGDCEPA